MRSASRVTCHAEIAEEWRASQHRSSFTDEPFTVAHALEPRAFCRECHAPEQDSSITTATADAEIGVGCISCHGGVDLVTASPRRASGFAPHPVRRDASFGSVGACATCHEFEFPPAGRRDEVALMQSTVLEHERSRFSDVACADCHMPRVGADGHRSHRFDASRDPSALRRSITATARQVDARTVEVSLRARHVGHAVPTGDLLRRLEVGAGPVDDPAASTRRYLARHFAPVRQRSGVVVRAEVRDDRVPADGSVRRVRLEFDEPLTEPVRWWVEYQRVAHHNTFSEHHATLDASTTLATGLLSEAEPGTP